MGFEDWAEWAGVVVVVGLLTTTVANLLLRRLESARYRRMNPSVRSQASAHASVHSEDDRSKNEWGARG